MASAGDVWKLEAQIVPAEEDSTTSVSTTVSTSAFLHRVGANERSVIKTEKDRATVEHWQHEIAHGKDFNVHLHLDSMGNVIGADGRHRAIAAQRAGLERIHVTVTRRLR
jgi:hypothetical protein